MKSFRFLGSDIEKKVDDFEEGHSKLVRTYALEGFGRIIQSTPVDKGFARNSWHADIDKEPTSFRESSDKSGREAMSSVRSAANSFSDRNSEIYLTSNAPYMRKLNDGHSEQAPSNFIPLAMQSAASAIKNFKLMEG